MKNADIWALAAFCFSMSVLHLVSIAMALVRCRRFSGSHPSHTAPVSIIRPLCGLDNYLRLTLESTFTLDHPCYEVILCVAHRADPAFVLAQDLIARYPLVPARLLVGDTRVSSNPKLNNIVKGWNAAEHDWIVIADSNVLMPPDYVARLLTAWRADTGLVCSPPIGTAPEGIWAELECSFLNAYQARWQYAADSVAFGFAQGKTMLWRRDILEGAGGIRSLGAEVAEDAAATKLVRQAGLRVRLVDAPFPQPLGLRRFRDVWDRQVRWSRLRRATFKRLYMLEILAGSLPPLVGIVALALLLDWPLAATMTLFIVAWYGAEALLCRVAGWPLTGRMLGLSILRDGLLPALWVAAWLGNSFVWRGQTLETTAEATAGSLKS